MAVNGDLKLIFVLLDTGGSRNQGHVHANVELKERWFVNPDCHQRGRSQKGGERHHRNQRENYAFRQIIEAQKVPASCLCRKVP